MRLCSTCYLIGEINQELESKIREQEQIKNDLKNKYNEIVALEREVSHKGRVNNSLEN